MAGQRARVGISSCLLGEAVRYDGGHKREDGILDALSQWVEWIPVCPEVELGLGVPRETIHLVWSPRGLRLQGTRSALDHTEAMEAYAHRRIGALAGAGLDGYVLKKRSPSCGMEGVPVVLPDGRPAGKEGAGLFARMLMERLPHLPVEEEDRLADPQVRARFLDRVRAQARRRSVSISSAPDAEA